MDNINQPDANGGNTYYNPYQGELHEPFSTDLFGNPTTEGGQQRISRNNRYQPPNTTVGPPLGDPIYPLLLLLTLLLIIKAAHRFIKRSAPNKAH